MAIKNCADCGEEFNGKKKQRYCSNKCAKIARPNTSNGEVKIENSEGKIVYRETFKTKIELRKILNSFKVAHCIIVKFN